MPARLQQSDRNAALRRIVDAIVYLQTQARRLARERAANHGLTPTQLSVVKLLDTSGDLSLSALSERMHSNNSTVTGIIDRMERDGLVRRARSKSDRRMWMIALTDRGRTTATQISDTPWDTLTHALAGLSAEDQEHLLSIIDRLARVIAKEVAADNHKPATAGRPKGSSKKGGSRGARR
jgi:MarR family transcriptional regulator, organic hydroperoxide resistance regulator